jgi:carboxylate-amine ligase
VVASGIVPVGGDDPQVSPNDRYRDMVETFGETARTGQTCGCHVHVAIDSPEEGVAVIDRITPWLPVLVAVAANSPYFEGRDTTYASWRSQAWTRWPSAGPTEAFESVEQYEETSRLLKMTGAARDDGMLYYDARLSKGQPTVEIRVLDVCTDLADTLLCAALIRGLVQTAADAWAAGEERDRWRAEVLRACTWRASHVGLSDTLVHPALRELRPAREVLDALVEHIRPALEQAGDLERVRAGVERVLQAGGATKQRAAFERTGTVEGVVDDLIKRTEATWA